MLYEQFFRWLTFDKRRNCEHDFEKVGYSYTHIGYGDAFKRDHYKCKKCGKKEKRHNISGGTYIMI